MVRLNFQMLWQAKLEVRLCCVLDLIEKKNVWAREEKMREVFVVLLTFDEISVSVGDDS